MKIHIIGGSGSGKTFLADKLSMEYNIEHYDLDDFSAKGKGLGKPIGFPKSNNHFVRLSSL